MDGSPGRPRPRFVPGSTALYGLLWLAVVVQGWAPLLNHDPVAWLQHPEATAERMSERDLELAEAMARQRGPLRPLFDRLYGSPAEARDYAIEIHRDLLERNDTPAVRQRLAVLLLEAGDESGLEATGPSGADALVDGDAFGVPGLSPGYLDRAERALAATRGDLATRAEAERRMAARGESWKWRSLALLGTNFALVAVGTAILATRLRRPREILGGPMQPPPWSLGDGLGVFVRGDFWNRSFFLALFWLESLPAAWPVLESPAGSVLQTVLHGWGTLFASLPLVWLIHRHLLRPAGVGFARVFGLTRGAREQAGLAGVALAAIAVDLVGTHAIGWLAWGAGVGSSWAEGFDEVLVWGSAAEATLTSLDYVAWTPAFEELAFRGILYFSLRRRLAVLPAAVATAGFFAVLHFYSLPGFAMTLWSGFVWALAFERTRSLVPGIAAHAVYNALFVAGLLLLYR